MPDLKKVSTTIYQGSTTQQWKELFNQATFVNYDPSRPLNVNKFVVPPGQTVGGVLYPTFMRINLNENEINDTMFIIDTGNSASASYFIIYTQYQGTV